MINQTNGYTIVTHFHSKSNSFDIVVTSAAAGVISIAKYYLFMIQMSVHTAN